LLRVTHHNGLALRTLTQQVLAPLKAAVTHIEINESIATVRKTRLFISLNRSHCTETIQ